MHYAVNTTISLNIVCVRSPSNNVCTTYTHLAFAPAQHHTTTHSTASSAEHAELLRAAAAGVVLVEQRRAVEVQLALVLGVVGRQGHALDQLVRRAVQLARPVRRKEKKRVE